MRPNLEQRIKEPMFRRAQRRADSSRRIGGNSGAPVKLTDREIPLWSNVQAMKTALDTLSSPAGNDRARQRGEQLWAEYGAELGC